MKVLIAFLFSISLLKCGDDAAIESVAPDCSEPATVVDYTGLDGCGLLLKLSDGKLIMPQRLVYIQAPTREEDPIYYYELKAGENVLIGYRVVEDVATSCMAEQLVAFITCIRAAD